MGNSNQITQIKQKIKQKRRLSRTNADQTEQIQIKVI